jgi:hypothetical protein
LTHPLSVFCYSEKSKNKVDQGTSGLDGTKEFDFSGNESNSPGLWGVPNHCFDHSPCVFDIDRALA